MAQQLGVKYDFFLALGAAGVPWQISQIEANPSIVSYVEGFNESDAWWQTYNGLTGAAATQAVQQALYTAVKSDPALAGVGVIQTSFANIANFQTYGNQSAYADYANTHSYFGTGNNPDGGNFANYLISLAQDVTPGKPTITTEAGYFTEPGNVSGVDQLVQAKYLLDLLFEQAQAGVKLTYIWELVDNFADPNNTNSEDHFGLFNADYTPKIGAIALHNLMQIFQDPGTGGVQPGTLNYTLTGMPSTANSSLYEKSDGTFMLVLWNDVRISGPTTQAEINVAPVTVTLTLTQPFTRITVYDPLTGTTAIQEFDHASTVQIAVPDHPVIVELSQVAAPAAPTGPTIATPNDVLTNPGALVHVDGVSVTDSASGNYTVQVSSQANALTLLNLAGHMLANDTNSVTLTGSLATINAELATLNYTGSAALGSDMITVIATDANGASTTKMIPVSVIAADAAVVSGGPLLSVPATFATAAGSTSLLPNLTLADPYAATHSGTMTMTVQDRSGKLQINPGTAAVTGNASSSLTITGSFAQITAALASMTYTAGAATGSDTVSFSITDQWGFSSSQQIAVHLTAPPTLAGPSSATALPVVAKSISGIALTDPAATSGANLVTVTLRDSNGTLTVPSASGVTGSGTNTLTVSGTLAAVNAELANLQYTLALGGVSDTIAVQATDLYGGTATSSVAINPVTSNAPNLTLASPMNVSAQTTAAAPFLTIHDPAAAQGSVSVTLASSLGRFATAGVTGVQVNSTANTITLNGTVAAVNTALGALSYTAGSQAGSDLVNISVVDSLGGATTSQTRFNVEPSPTITLPTGGLVRIGGTLAVKGVAVGDSFATAQGTPVKVTVTDTIGTLSATSNSATVTGSGSNNLSVAGTVSQVSAALGTLVYTAGTHGGADQVVFTETDAYGGTAQQTVTETTAQPKFTLPAAPLVGTKGTTSLSGISLQDACNGKVSGNLIVHVSTIANMGGTLSITNLSGAQQTGSGPYAFTLTGTLSQIDAALATLTYTAGTHTGFDNVIIDAWDQLGSMSKINLEVGIGTQTVVVGNASTPQVITGYTTNGGLLLDMRQVMSETGWDGQTSTLSKYLQVRATSGGTELSITPNGNSASSHDIALLQGATVSLADVELHNLLIPDSSTAAGGVTITDTGSHTATISGQASAVATALTHTTYTSTGSTYADPTTNSTALLGWNNVFDAGAGNNFFNGLQSGDVFRLNAGGQGLNTISGFSLTNGDQIDLSRAIAGLNVASDLSNVGNYLTASVSGTDTILSINPTGAAGGASAIARLMNVNTSVSQLLSDHSLIRMAA